MRPLFLLRFLLLSIDVSARRQLVGRRDSSVQSRRPREGSGGVPARAAAGPVGQRRRPAGAASQWLAVRRGGAREAVRPGSV